MSLFGKKPNSTPQDVSEFYAKFGKQNYTVKKNGKLTREARKLIKAERKLLRKKLIEAGIKSRLEFEQIARDLGLVLDGGRKVRGLILLSLNWSKLVSSLGLKSILLGSGTLLTTMFMISALADKAGSFTINLTADMLRSGYVLSETADFKEEKSRLFSEEIQEVNNITFEDIAQDVDMIDGPHNANNYIAYTFYIKNTGESASTYNYFLRCESQTMNVASAIWVMLFEDGKQILYAKEGANGEPEGLYGYNTKPPFADSAYYYDKQYYELNGKYGVITTPFVSDKIVAQGMVEDVEPQEVHKYTVVMWVEGNDPECTNDIFGGYAKFSMDFEKGRDENNGGLFKGIYRTEYDDYYKEYSNVMKPTPEPGSNVIETVVKKNQDKDSESEDGK
jgi:hypothetical protein